MILNCILWWTFSTGALGNVEYLFIAITPRSTLTLYLGQIDWFKIIRIRKECVQKQTLK